MKFTKYKLKPGMYTTHWSFYEGKVDDDCHASSLVSPQIKEDMVLEILPFKDKIHSNYIHFYIKALNVTVPFHPNRVSDLLYPVTVDYNKHWNKFNENI